MILRALYEYYQRKAEDPESGIAPRGFERKEIPFVIVIDSEGNFVNLEDTRTGEGPKRRAKTFLVIKMKSRTGVNGWKIANTFWDHWGFVLGQAKNESSKALADAENQNSTFIAQVKGLSEKYPANPEFRAVCLFYDLKDEVQKVLNHESWPDCYKIPGCNLSFRVAGRDSLVAEHPDLAHEVESEVAIEEFDQNVENNGVCLVTGEKSTISVLHAATPVPGGKSGGKLVGFQRNSGYDSYYKEQGLNAPVSQKAEDAYTTALNVLLSKDSRNKFKIGDTTVIFWAQKEISFENQFSFFFNISEKDDPDRNIREVKALFDSIYTGKLNKDCDTPFYVLGLAPNAARIVVRFWKSGRVEEFATHIAQHFSDLEIVRGTRDEKEYFSLFYLLSNLAFEHKIENILPNLAGKVMESILDGTPYPATLQQQ